MAQSVNFTAAVSRQICPTIRRTRMSTVIEKPVDTLLGWDQKGQKKFEVLWPSFGLLV